MKKNRLSRGFLLIEVLVSILVIGVTVLVINRAFSVSLRASRLSSDYMAAINIIYDKSFDFLINEQYFQDQKTGQAEIDNKNFVYFISSKPVEIDSDKYSSFLSDSIGIKQITLGVDWSEGNYLPADRDGLRIETYAWDLK